MQIENTIALVTGANRGLGRAFVRALLDAGARRVFAAARNPDSLAETVALDPERVTRLRIDVTAADPLAHVDVDLTDLRLLINNAGTLASTSVVDSSLEQLRLDFETNVFGMLGVTRALLPKLKKGAAVVNVLSLVSLANMPSIGGYAASKAASHSLTQALRQELRPRGVRVFGVLPGAIDTDMLKGVDIPKTLPLDVARATLDAIGRDQEEIFPDAMSRQLSAGYYADPRAFEAQVGAM